MGFVVGYRVGTSPAASIIADNTSGCSVGTGTLTNGTSDGTDGSFNIYTHTDGKIYLKNRLGGG
jgi:hypothetical protein